jgi:hypothetical protein
MGTGSREENASNQKSEHDPEKHALGLDPRVDTGFPKSMPLGVGPEGSGSITKLARLRFNQKRTRSDRVREIRGTSGTLQR